MYNVINDKKEFELFLKENFNNALASRRLWFNFLYESYQTRGYWNSDIWSGNASGILIRMKDRFFILTAKHCLNLTDLKQNESPIWVDVDSNPINRNSNHQFLFCGGIWKIWTIINDQKFNNCLVDGQDIALIEMFRPHPNYLPDNYIEINSIDDITTKDDLNQGDLLIITGFPAHLNQYYWDNKVPVGFTHRTDIQRQWLLGRYVQDDDCGHIKLIGKDEEFKLKGFSGGLVLKLDLDINKQKIVGLVTSGTKDIIRFIPIWLVIDELLNFEGATFDKLDPRFNRTIEEVINEDHNGSFADFLIFQAEMLQEKNSPRQNIKILKNFLKKIEGEI